jgi:hypothetical protein
MALRAKEKPEPEQSDLRDGESAGQNPISETL